MYPKGTIYHRLKRVRKGTIFLHAPLKTKLIYKSLRLLGASLISSVLTVIIISFAPVAGEEISYSVTKTSQAQKIIDGFDLTESVQAQETALIQSQAKELGVDSYFSVVIPKINAKSDITANVDTNDEKVYTEALSRGVAHAKGTYFPGQGKTIFLFSHSTSAPWLATRYSAVFYLLNKMNKGDSVTVFFADRRYDYEVVETKIVSPSDTSWLEAGDSERLILQTCTPPGTNFKRLLVIAKPI